MAKSSSCGSPLHVTLHPGALQVFATAHGSQLSHLDEGISQGLEACERPRMTAVPQQTATASYCQTSAQSPPPLRLTHAGSVGATRQWGSDASEQQT